MARIYELVKKIPAGRVATYKQIAELAGLHSRAVAAALRKNPNLRDTPCYRVVHSDCRVGGYALGRPEKIKRLRRDGIKVRNGKVDLKEYLYDFNE